VTTSEECDKRVKRLRDSVALVHEYVVVDVFLEDLSEVVRVRLRIVIQVKLVVEHEPVEEVFDEGPHHQRADQELERELPEKCFETGAFKVGQGQAEDDVAAEDHHIVLEVALGLFVLVFVLEELDSVFVLDKSGPLNESLELCVGQL